MTDESWDDWLIPAPDHATPAPVAPPAAADPAPTPSADAAKGWAGWDESTSPPPPADGAPG